MKDRQPQQETFIEWARRVDRQSYKIPSVLCYVGIASIMVVVFFLVMFI